MEEIGCGRRIDLDLGLGADTGTILLRCGVLKLSPEKVRQEYSSKVKSQRAATKMAGLGL